VTKGESNIWDCKGQKGPAPPSGHSIENALVYDTTVVYKTAFVYESNFVYDNAFVVDEPCDTTPPLGQVDCSL
jgi:hypothetical protein